MVKRKSVLRAAVGLVLVGLVVAVGWLYRIGTHGCEATCDCSGQAAKSRLNPGFLPPGAEDVHVWAMDLIYDAHHEVRFTIPQASLGTMLDGFGCVQGISNETRIPPGECSWWPRGISARHCRVEERRGEFNVWIAPQPDSRVLVLTRNDARD
jgi:hypothetical protein